MIFRTAKATRGNLSKKFVKARKKFLFMFTISVNILLLKNENYSISYKLHIASYTAITIVYVYLSIILSRKNPVLLYCFHLVWGIREIRLG